jgi:hypothetical protein
MLYNSGFLSCESSENSATPFWKSFNHALKINKKGPDGKQRILSIIAENFTYEKLECNLEVSMFRMV